jgi:hypothetical protein
MQTQSNFVVCEDLPIYNTYLPLGGRPLSLAASFDPGNYDQNDYNSSQK